MWKLSTSVSLMMSSNAPEIRSAEDITSLCAQL
jgi:hypothetical protein